MDDNTQKPRHVAIIMDGNGRWAASRNMPRSYGHKEGANAVRRTIRAAGELGLEFLTLYGFSSENWKRPRKEITELMKLLRYYLRSETAELHRNNVRVRVIGDIKRFDADIQELIVNAETLTQDNTGLTLVIALNYGGRQETVRAARQISRMTAERGRVLTEEEIAELWPAMLDTAGIPDPDLLIRTSGEQRISNFLPWQTAYSELYFTSVLWPDFDGQDLQEAIASYAGRQRRFGSVAVSEG